ncbi:MAG: nitroreductase family protein [Candidatus Heimdallarchaeota archaeon]
MDYFEVVIRNKRHRKFKSGQTALNSDQLKQLMACAQLSPSLSEIQNYTFILVSDPTVKENLIHLVPASEWAADAPAIFAVVVVVSDESEEADDTNIIDAIISTSQLMMAATAMGLGCNLLVEFDQDAINQLMGVKDERLTTIALVPIGEAIDEGSQGYKRSISDLLNHNSLGTPYEFEK